MSEAINKKIRKPREPKIKSLGPRATNSRNWKAKCPECSGIMDYWNLKYGCRKCGHVMEV